MSKLRERLQDASRSGVYRASAPEAIEEAVRGTGFNLGRISLAAPPGKEAMLERIARALAFPDWFGGNWDALEDCLTDLSWLAADGHVLVFERFQADDDLGVLIDVLASSAAFWAARGKPFFAVFLDPRRKLALASLYRER
jgi:Barstar (barnase inhibitor)